jgi:hypothetical protein
MHTKTFLALKQWRMLKVLTFYVFPWNFFLNHCSVNWYTSWSFLAKALKECRFQIFILCRLSSITRNCWTILYLCSSISYTMLKLIHADFLFCFLISHWLDTHIIPSFVFKVPSSHHHDLEEQAWNTDTVGFPTLFTSQTQYTMKLATGPNWKFRGPHVHFCAWNFEGVSWSQIIVWTFS